MKQPDHVQNQAVKPSWNQLWRETICSVKGHVFYVAWGNDYRALPQSHCYRCGAPCPHFYKGNDWIPPIG